MPIKRRATVPNEKQAEIIANTGPLNIVAKPKKPMPTEPSIVNQVYGDNPSQIEMLRFGNVALACDETTADEKMNIVDRVTAMRTPYDTSNPQEIRYRNRVRNRGTAITAMCVVCQGGRKAVTECIATTCPLWAFRFGSDPFWGKKQR